jgi:hypothetical protein
MMKKRFWIYLLIGSLLSSMALSCAGTPETKTAAPAQAAPAVKAPTAAMQPAPAAAPSAPAAAAPKAADLSKYEKPGFAVAMEKERLWVFRPDSKGYEEFKKSGEPARQVIRPGAGPGGITLKSTDSETLDEYITTLPGYYTKMEKERLWVFKSDSKELAEFLKSGEPARQVIRPAAGPFGMTIKAVDGTIIDEYMAKWDAAAK